ncbi:MAG TPA: DUF805 domain-containing protein [Caulobacteraceae bacterium]|jgi:uncharacterized membrane protein YhaH (DUF805 family)
MRLLFSFEGRLDRRTYRYCRIFANLAFLILLSIEQSVLENSRSGANPWVLLLYALVVLALDVIMIWSTLAMQVKRRHDRDKSWPWLFLGFIPIVGPLWVFVECCWLDGTPGYNRYDRDQGTAAVFA